jgi:chemosensory pili system protein ChpA (sensor histidine kinase/response regulator)
MVGAIAMGEFAWALENLLNKVIDGKISTDERLFKLVSEASEKLGERFEYLLQSVTIDADIQSIIDQANSLAEGNELALQPEITDSDNDTGNETRSDASDEIQPTSEADEHASFDAPGSADTISSADTTNVAEDEPQQEHNTNHNTPELRSVEETEPRQHAPVMMDAVADNVTDTHITDKNPDKSADVNLEAEESSAADVENTPVVSDPLVAIYLEELSELLDGLEVSVQLLLEDPENPEVITEAERQLHTIKGGARMTGLSNIADLSHAAESLLTLIANQQHTTDEYTLQKLQEVADELYAMSEAVSLGADEYTAEPLLRDLNQLVGVQPNEADNMAPEPVDTDDSSVSDDEESQNVIDMDVPISLNVDNVGSESSSLEKLLADQSDALPPPCAVLVESATEEGGLEDVALESTVRVSSNLINQLIATSNEWSFQHIRLNDQLGQSESTLDELKRTSSRLREQLRRLEMETETRIRHSFRQTYAQKKQTGFDPLEMDEYSEVQQYSRALAETLDDLRNVQDDLEKQYKSVEETLIHQEKISRELQQGLISTRMTKVSGMLPRLRRITRQTSSELGKMVELVVADEASEMDRTILQRITASLEHLLRNAIAHGIESPEQREKAGKPETGKIFLEFDREGAEVVIKLKDDGCGINVDAIRRKAEAKGVIKKGAQLSQAEIYRLILMSGVSTADKVSQISGRGVGMDVVNAEVNALGGTVIIDSKQGEYTSFTIRLPYTLATTQVLFVNVSEELLAVPVAKVVALHRVNSSVLARNYATKEPMIQYMGQSYRLRHLGKTLGLPYNLPETDDNKIHPLMLLEENDRRIAFQVDDIQGSREVMLKPLGELFEHTSLLSTATVLGDGRIALILNAQELIRMGADGSYIKVHDVELDESLEKQTVMIVDDSITVRKITEGLLKSLGYLVITATDGVNALEILETQIPDIILLDIEMPRMDGFELLARLRATPELEDVPVIMISSRTGNKHRGHAEKMGASGFIGKPWQAEQLLKDIQAVMNEQQTEVTV